jgi:hypothetical protein
MNRRSYQRTFKGRVLDASLEADPRDYRLMIAPPQPGELQSRKWECPVRLDQGREGACVGFGGAHHIACFPWPQKLTEAIARFFYEGAQDYDEWSGSDYEGTSGNGLMTFLHRSGVIGNYYRVRSRIELDRLLSVKSPVSGGFPWREGMFEADRNGFVRYEGEVKGGHYVCVNGVDFENEFYWIVQSWGRHHGIDGEVKVSFADMDKMIGEGGNIYWFEEKSIGPIRNRMKKEKKPWWKFWA